ncbi:MAG TPA: VWA domain-containing protein [Candidatus Binatia bacterium]|nr:VWA domain-containing protein [Candidatus Binatia bacterium]
MRRRLLEFTQTLRAHGFPVSVSESMDAVSAVAAAGVERETLREALAATLVKDEAGRPDFDRLFDIAFPLGGAAVESARRRRDRRGDAGAGGRGGDAAGAGSGRRRDEESDAHAAGPTSASRDDARGTGARARDAGERPHRGRTARQRELLERPLELFTARDVAEARDLVRELGARLRGRLARRERALRRGRLDLRRTLRVAVTSGGVPVRLRRRGRRPGRPDLIALCDLSGSVAAASELLLGLIAPAARYLRRVHLFAYVDRLCPVSIEQGHVAPDGPLDLHARSDFGRVLGDLWSRERHLLGRGSLVLILGDARNNRLPPRADLLRAVRERVDRILWVVPEPRARWNTGDSVLRQYAPSCDVVLEGLTLDGLVAAVRRAL